MSDKLQTILVLGVSTVVLVAWDIWVAVRPPKGDTITSIIRGWATKHPVVPFALGVLMGHLFWT